MGVAFAPVFVQLLVKLFANKIAMTISLVCLIAQTISTIFAWNFYWYNVSCLLNGCFSSGILLTILYVSKKDNFKWGWFYLNSIMLSTVGIVLTVVSGQTKNQINIRTTRCYDIFYWVLNSMFYFLSTAMIILEK